MNTIGFGWILLLGVRCVSGIYCFDYVPGTCGERNYKANDCGYITAMWGTSEGYTCKTFPNVDSPICPVQTFCSDTNCVPCMPGYYCPNKSPYFYRCKTTCAAGTYFDGRACDGCQDRACPPCPADKWCRDEKSNNCSKPIKNTYIASPCNATHDTVIVNCTVCSSNQYIASPCNSTANAICKNCPPNSYPKPNSTSYFDCACKDGYNGRITDPDISGCFLLPPNTVCINDCTTYLDVVCKEGFYGKVYAHNYTTCQPCPPNKFCPGPKIAKKVCPCATQ